VDAGGKEDYWRMKWNVGKERGKTRNVPISGGGVLSRKVEGQNFSQTTTSSCMTAIMHQTGGRMGRREGRRKGKQGGRKSAITDCGLLAPFLPLSLPSTLPPHRWVPILTDTDLR
jgi:hypothetical protein